MENKIQVGEYVRTKCGISKVIKNVDEFVTEEQICVDFIDRLYHQVINKNMVINHSQNMMDLIEEGDVIVLKDNKKYEVLKISWSKSKGKHIHIIYPLRMYGGIDIFENDIKSIVTKEQFEAIEYEV